VTRAGAGPRGAPREGKRGAPPAGTGDRGAIPVSTRNARFQQWEALLANRTKRTRSGLFLIHGVRPITLAVDRRWPLESILLAAGGRRSPWAADVLAAVEAPRFALADELLRELGGKDEETPELVAVGRLRPDDLGRVDLGGDAPLLVVFDRPTSPGNLGTLVRSADAFGARGVLVVGHAADIYDPRTVRASTGSLFTVPVVHAPAAADVLTWLREQRDDLRIVGTDETGTTVDRLDFRGPTVVVVGNETSGMSAAWRAACTEVASIPIGGTASSLNAASAATVVLYEAARQRGFPGSRQSPEFG
jgi:23S rRNA (uridine2479-2'-O)-methyltransferase